MCVLLSRYLFWTEHLVQQETLIDYGLHFLQWETINYEVNVPQRKQISF